MSSTASDIKAKKAPVKRKKATGKKKATRKTVSKKSKSGTTKVKKKTVAKKKAARTRKAAGKKATTAKKSSVKKPAKKTSRKSVKKSGLAAASASGEAALQPDVTKTTVAAEDSKSLSWMAAQAASALKAVRANQTERAQVLIAKAEITPAAPARPRKAATPGIAADISAEIEGPGATPAIQAPALTAEAAEATETGETTQSPASALAAQPVAETPRTATPRDTTPATADTVDTTEKPAQTTTKPAEQKKRAAPAREAKPEKTEILPKTTSLPPAPDAHTVSGPASEPARVETAPAQAAKPVSAENTAAAINDKNDKIIVSEQTVTTNSETTPEENVAAPAVVKTADAVVQNPAKTAADQPQPQAIIKPPSNPPATQPAAVIAAASTNTRNRHPARRLLIPGIMVLVAILGIRSWLADDETPGLATTPVISETQQTAPVTGSKSAAEAIAVVTGKPAKKPATAGLPADDWSPTTRPGWPQSSDYPQRAAATTNSVETAPQGQLPQQNPAVTTQANRPATPRPGYYSPGYGYYPQQPLPQQPRYQPAYSRPSYLQ